MATRPGKNFGTGRCAAVPLADIKIGSDRFICGYIKFLRVELMVEIRHGEGNNVWTRQIGIVQEN
jgi:hypothetical protein